MFVYQTKVTPSAVRRSPLVGIRAQNVLRALEHIREQEVTSRSSTARALGLTRATASAVVKDLLDAKLVLESGPGDSPAQGGRRPTLLRANPRYGSVLALRVSKQINGAWINFANQSESPFEWTWPDSKPNPRWLCQQITSTLSAREEKGGQLLGVAIAVAGLVQDGRVLVSSPLGWKDVELRKRLEGHAGVPVHVDKDTNAAALRFFHKHGNSYRNSILYVAADESIGSAFVHNGTPFLGANGGASELGHTFVGKLNEPCPCGSTGCLALYVGLNALERQGYVSPGQSFESALEVLERTEPAVLANMGRYLGIALANAVNLVDPELIVLAGALTRISAFRDAVQETLTQRALTKHQIELQLGVLGWQEAVQGVAETLLRRIIRHSLAVEGVES